MRAELSVEAADLMAANPGWIVLPDERFPMLFALPGHLRGAFWLYDTDRIGWKSVRRRPSATSAGRLGTPRPGGRRVLFPSQEDALRAVGPASPPGRRQLEGMRSTEDPTHEEVSCMR
jgi:hypothetical protein